MATVQHFLGFLAQAIQGFDHYFESLTCLLYQEKTLNENLQSDVEVIPLPTEALKLPSLLVAL